MLIKTFLFGHSGFFFLFVKQHNRLFNLIIFITRSRNSFPISSKMGKNNENPDPVNESKKEIFNWEKKSVKRHLLYVKQVSTA